MTTDSIDPGLAHDALGDVRPVASYTLRVNGFERPVTDAWIGESLLYVLRERLGLAGAKDGCEQGECGACSVQVDGQLVAGCLVPAALAADSEIATVEGLSGAGTASDVQQALAESGAVQCGYCTPGLAMAVHDLLQRNHRPSDVEARQALCGNLCRCTGYRGVLAAVQSVSQAREAELEAELATAAEQAESAPEERTEPTAAPAPAPAPARPAGQQSAADLPLAGELPLYADSELWVEADQYAAAHPPAAAPGPHTAHQSGVYEPGYYGTPQDGQQAPYIPAQGGPFGTGHPGADHGGHPGGGYDPATYETGLYEATPAHGTAHDGPPHDATPAHGTPYIPTPAHGTAHDGGYTPTPPHGTPVYGTPAPYPGYEAGAGYAVPGYGAPGHDPHAAPVHGIPGYDGTVYDGTTPAHGILIQPSAGGSTIPEDENA
ncbi:(2Fe-2S)-binding protein [Kitasatospora sp. NPDC059571]|uniref:(2Fe-2S)-binding protein n=1 Tax=Kitasatospora sp. NPDC059571 TaxID=3346871 RepID=UPI0036C279E8